MRSERKEEIKAIWIEVCRLEDRLKTMYKGGKGAYEEIASILEEIQRLKDKAEALKYDRTEERN